MDELEKELKPLLCSSQLRFNIHWTGDEEVVLEPKPGPHGMDEVEPELLKIKPALRKSIKAKGLAQEVELCCVGKDRRILNREDQKWAVVAGPKKGSSSTSTVPAWAGRPGITISQNGFGALDSPSMPRMIALGGNKSSESLKEKERKERERKEKKKEKKKHDEEIVDDWEVAADEEEARSHAATTAVELVTDETAAEEKVTEAQSNAIDADAHTDAFPLGAAYTCNTNSYDESEGALAGLDASLPITTNNP